LFTISARGIYGLTAVTELAINYNGNPMQIKDISEINDIPRHYLEQLLVVLKKAGITESVRGSRGGYILAKPPSEIKVLDVFTCLEGKLEVVPEDKREGMLSFFWNTLEKKIISLLDMSLEELVLKKQAFEKQLIYHI